MATKRPPVRSRASAIKKKLLSGNRQLVDGGLADLAAAEVAVADELFRGVSLRSHTPAAGFAIWGFNPNAHFDKKAPDRGPMLRAIAMAPAGSEVARLRDGVDGLAVTGDLDLGEVLSGFPMLRALDIGPGVTGLAALAAANPPIALLQIRPVDVFDLRVLHGAPLTHLVLGAVKQLLGVATLNTLKLELLELSLDLDATHVVDCPLRALLVNANLAQLDRLPRSLRELRFRTVDGEVNWAALERLPLESLAIIGPTRELPAHPDLQRLSLHNSELTHLTGLGKLPNLREVHLNNCPNLRELTGVPLTARLERIRIRRCENLEAVRRHEGTDLWKVLEIQSCGPQNRLGHDVSDLVKISFPEASVRSSAVRSLASVKGQEVTAALKRRLEVDTDPSVLRQAAKALVGRTDMEATVVHALQHGSPAAREAAAWAMFGPRVAAALEPLIAGLEAIGPSAAISLSRIPGNISARTALEGACAAADPEMRRWSAFTLGAIGSPESEGVLAGLLADDNERVRRAAIGSLFRIGATDTLARGLRDPSPELANLARCWLAVPPTAGDPAPSRIGPQPEKVSISTSGLPTFARIDLARVAFLDIGAGKYTVIDDDYALPALPALTHLAILSRKMTCARPVAGQTGLQWLWLSWNKKMRDLEGVQGLAQLRSLIIRNTIVKDLAPLAGLDLAELGASHTRIADLTPLYSNTKLEMLSVAKTSVASLEGIGALSRLNLLNIGGTRVTDLSPLVELQQLRTLGLYDLKQADFAPLVQMSKLDDIDVLGTRFDHSEWALFQPRINVLLPTDYHRTDPHGHRAIAEANEADRNGRTSSFGWTI